MSYEAIAVTDYLQGRRYNQTLVERVTEEMRPIVEKYNDDYASEDEGLRAVVRFSMSAKHQTMNCSVTTVQADDDCEDLDEYDLPPGFDNLVGQLETLLSSYYDGDEFEFRYGKFIMDLD